MVASLFNKLHSPEYWVMDVLIPWMFALSMWALAMTLLRVRPSWVWVNAAAGAYSIVSLIVLIAAHRSGFTALMAHKESPEFGPTWVGIIHIMDFVPSLMSAIVPMFLVLCADAIFHPVTGKCVKLLQAAVVVVSTVPAVYVFAKEGWSQPSFHLASFVQIAGADISFIGMVLILGISWLIGVALSLIRAIDESYIEVYRAMQSTSDWIASLQRRLLSRI